MNGRHLSRRLYIFPDEKRYLCTMILGRVYRRKLQMYPIYIYTVYIYIYWYINVYLFYAYTYVHIQSHTMAWHMHGITYMNIYDRDLPFSYCEASWSHGLKLATPNRADAIAAVDIPTVHILWLHILWLHIFEMNKKIICIYIYIHFYIYIFTLLYL